MILADSTLIATFVTAGGALVGVLIMAAVQINGARERRRIAQRAADAAGTAAAAENKADIVTAVFNTQQKMVDTLSTQNASQQEQLNAVRALADRCESERAELLVRVSRLEQGK